MIYRVVTTAAAEEEIAESYRYIGARSPMNAIRWVRQLYVAIDALGEFHGYASAPESIFLKTDLRHKKFKSHRIIYSVDDVNHAVIVHFVRHGARRAVGEPKLEDDE